MKQLLTLVAISCTTIALTACGDDVTNVTENNVGVQSFESYQKLPDCSKNNQGEMAIVTKEGLVYYCDDKEWKKLNGDGEPGENGADGKSGKDGKKGDKGETGAKGDQGEKGDAGTDGADGKNGSNGINGKDGSDGTNGVDGKDGEDGSSCVANKLTNGIEIKCGGVVIDTLKNGEKGEKGEKGESCKAFVLPDSSYNFICGNDTINIKNVSNGDSQNFIVKNKNISGVAQKVLLLEEVM